MVPRLGKKPLRTITVDQVSRLHRSMKETPIEANRTLTALSAVLGFADRKELVPAHFNPCRHVERFAETGTRRALTDTELKALGEALADAEKTGSVPVMEDGKPLKRDGKRVRATVSPSALLAIRLLALTGFRRSEVLGQSMKDRRGSREGLRWGDVDLKTGLVHLRDTKTGKQTRVIGAAASSRARHARVRRGESLPLEEGGEHVAL